MVLCIRAAILLGSAVMILPAQSTRVEDLGVGKFLVASQDLADPNFAETVVLLVKYEEDGVVGLIINRPTKIRLSRLAEQLKTAKGRSDPVYAGGPVGKSSILGLVRSRSKLEGGEFVFDDVYLITSKAPLEKTIAAESSMFHVYLGYAGWTGPQLEREVELGGWYIFGGNSDSVFDTGPESIWQRLIRKTEQQVASAPRPDMRVYGDGGPGARSSRRHSSPSP
jgi:putative AlgH/UPF0301 family transcriptional regulator